MDYFQPEVSGSPHLSEFRLIVLARRPDFRELRVPGRFVVHVGSIFVYYMLRCMFWVVSDSVLTLGALVFVYYIRRVVVDGFVQGCEVYVVCDVWKMACWDVFRVLRCRDEFCGDVCWEDTAASLP